MASPCSLSEPPECSESHFTARNGPCDPAWSMAAPQLGLIAACLHLLGSKTVTPSPSGVRVLPQITLDLLLILEGAAHE